MSRKDKWIAGSFFVTFLSLYAISFFASIYILASSFNPFPFVLHQALFFYFMIRFGWYARTWPVLADSLKKIPKLIIVYKG